MAICADYLREIVPCDAGLQHLPRGLQELNLTGCSSLRDDGLQHVAALTALTLLSLASCPCLTDAGLAHLSSLATLQGLILSRNRLLSDCTLALLLQLAGRIPADAS